MQTWRPSRLVLVTAGLVLLMVAAATYFFRADQAAWLRLTLTVGGYACLAGAAWLVAMGVWPQRAESDD